MTSEDSPEEEAPPSTAADIAAWLLERIEAAAPSYFYQSQAVMQIRNRFGSDWSYKNQNGNWAISKEVLKEFAKLKYPKIQWQSGIQAWQLVSDEKLRLISERKAAQKQRREKIAQQKAEQNKTD